MQFETVALPGLRLLVPEPVSDERGFFMRTFCEREFRKAGLATSFVQHSTSLSRLRGTIRGMHWQQAPLETKVVRCLAGAIYDVVVDLRAGQPTFGRWQAFELTAANHHQLYIPAGFAHGFQALTDDARVGYLISEFYVPEASRGLRFDDPAIGIDWPLSPTMVSPKDLAWPDFAGAGLPADGDRDTTQKGAFP